MFLIEHGNVTGSTVDMVTPWIYTNQHLEMIYDVDNNL